MIWNFTVKDCCTTMHNQFFYILRENTMSEQANVWHVLNWAVLTEHTNVKQHIPFHFL